MQQHVVAFSLNCYYVARIDKENLSLYLEGDAGRMWPCRTLQNWEGFH